MKFNDFLNNLSNYEPGKDIELIAREYGVSEVIKLASNENPLGTSPLALKALQENAYKAYLYPDDSMSELKMKLANKFKVSEKELIIGAGSDQIIEYAVHSKLNAQNAFLQCGVSFAMYEIYAKQTGAKCYKTASITHDLSELKALYSKHKDEIKLVFLCVPNNPLGECLNASEVEDFLSFVDEDCLVAIDAAYNEFASFKDEKKHLEPQKLLKKYKNALYLGTFSKLYALGGLRIGYGVANEEIIKAFYKLRAPFNVTNLSLKAAVVALDDEDFISRTLENNFNEMKLYEEFALKHAISFIPSYTNFITYFFDEKNSSDLSEKLLKKGIIIRNLKSYGLNAVRITIGKPYENERFFTEFEKII
ncbi:histidinol-phosphate transaminase [Campylobacter sp. MIT 12-5580]|uniref:histidinol-phosphate transaminase n=1 Tax=Campylobacter sp. MIT 12-5580 TaxID=2040651 RepID=UPI0010F60828|nr:histidinol-phosphate transaminase [Campylobacter sp. MIT 12-5580]TKX28444.1 histidinol-phosphate transaminase [Campylobacter sp. MIT 12-5580]